MIQRFFQEMYARRYTERYLIYKGSGGLFHNLTGLSEAIKIARRQNRKLIIDMKQHPAFQLNLSTFFKLETEYYEDYSILKNFDAQKIKEIQESKGRAINELKKKYLTGEIVVFTSCGGGLIDRRIKVNRQRMEQLKKEERIDEPYISVHFRNTDIQNEIFPFIEKIKKVSAEQNIHVLYVASDDFYIYEKMKKQLSEMRVIRKVIPVKGVKNIHYKTEDKYKQIYESLLDIYFILKSDFFIPSYNSGYSRGIIKMIKRGFYFFPDFSSHTTVVK